MVMVCSNVGVYFVVVDDDDKSYIFYYCLLLGGWSKLRIPHAM